MVDKKSAKKPPLHKRIFRKVRRDNERGAREAVLQELFNDFNRNRFTIYKFNFFRGIFFGLGSVLGATIVVGLVIWILSMLGNIFPSFDHFFNGVTHTIESGKK